MRTSEADPGANRRHAPRASIRCEASISLSDDRRIVGSTVDLSNAGVCLSLPIALQPGDRCGLRLNLGTPDRVEIVEMRGRVCFCVPQQHGYRIGMHCTDIDADAAQLIEEMLGGADHRE